MTDIKYPEHLLEALNNGWSVRSFDAPYKDSKDNWRMYIIHESHDIPLSIPMPPWLRTMLTEERVREQYRIQDGIKNLLGIKS